MKRLIFFLILSGFCPNLKSQTKADQQSAARLDSILNAYSQQNMFNGSVLVAKGGKVLLNKGYGFASLTHDVPNKPDTKFKLASVTKQFTAMAIMILQEQGKLNVNDSLSKYIPDYPNGNKITLHHLLNHSSGIPNITSDPRFDSIRYHHHSPEQLIAYFKPLPLNFEPGTETRYSNSGYIVLSYIIEKVSGVSYGEFITANIFKKLGMNNSGYCGNNAVIRNFAEGYTQTPEGYFKPAYIDMSIPLGAGALYSTTEDMYLWDRALYTEKLVKKSSLDRMFAPSATGMGYGWMINDFNGRQWIFHRGRIEGFSTVINRFPEQDLCIIILKNVDNQTYFQASEIAMQVMFNEPYALPVIHKQVAVDASVFKKLAGEYFIDSGFVFTVTDSIGQLFIQATGEPQLRLLPEGELNYFLFEVNATIRFTMGADGKAESLILTQDGQEMPGKRVR